MYPVVLNAAQAKGWKLVGGASEKLGGKSCGNQGLPTCNVHWVSTGGRRRKRKRRKRGEGVR